MPMPHTTGHTTKYKGQETLDVVDAYIAGGWRDLEGHVCPTIEGFALFAKISKRTLYNWSKTYQEFQEAFEMLRLFCEASLVQGALGDRLKERTAALVLSTHYSYADKAQVETLNAQSPETVIDSIKKMLGSKGNSK
jgi:hypothetical protein